MNQSYLSAFGKLIRRIENLHNQLQHLFAPGIADVCYKKHQLQKQYERCLKKLAHLISPVVKAGAVLGLTTILNTSAPAQQQPCSTFHNAVYNNPIKRVALPYLGLGKPAFVDIDGDGDYDCFEEYYTTSGHTHIGNIVFLRNKGTKEIPYFVQDAASGFPSTLAVDLGPYPFKIDGAVFADMDGDGDYDCILGGYVGGFQKIIYFENTGTKKKPVFVERDGAANPFSFVYGYYGLSYALADIDSDGDYDLITTNYYEERIYINTGTTQSANFSDFQNVYVGIGGHVSFYDWNQDGLMDFFMGSVYNKNVGTPTYPIFQISNQGPHLPPYFYLQQFTDINNDGFVDAFNEYGDFATTSPDALIKVDSINNILQAYPKKDSFSYRWQRNGKQIPGATADHYIPKLPGMYTIEITGSCGTGVSYPYAYKTTQKTLTGEEENSLIVSQIVASKSLHNASIVAYPNPFTSSFVLQLNAGADLSKTTIRITDISGRMVQTIQPNSYTVQLGESLAKGVFVVEVRKDKTVVYKGKIVKE